MPECDEHADISSGIFCTGEPAARTHLRQPRYKPKLRTQDTKVPVMFSIQARRVRLMTASSGSFNFAPTTARTVNVTPPVIGVPMMARNCIVVR